MALSTALMLAPPALRLGANVTGIGKSGPTDFENELGRMAELFKAESSQPVTDTRAFRSGKTLLDERDRDNRRAISNTSAVTGGTDEAKLATIDNANRTFNQGLQQLLSHAERIKQQNRSRYLNTLGAQESARQNRIAGDQQAFNDILNPLSQAGQAFAMADLFANNDPLDSFKKAKKVGAPDAVHLFGDNKTWGFA